MTNFAFFSANVKLGNFLGLMYLSVCWASRNQHRLEDECSKTGKFPRFVVSQPLLGFQKPTEARHVEDEFSKTGKFPRSVVTSHSASAGLPEPTQARRRI